MMVATDRLSAEFSERLRSERQRLKLSQGDIADAAGIKKPTQVAYEAGGRIPSIDYVHALSALGIDVWWVLFGIRSARHVSKEFNWSLLGEIHAAIRDWCESRNVDLSSHEEMELSHGLYDQFLAEEQMEPASVERMLKLIISGRAA